MVLIAVITSYNTAVYTSLYKLCHVFTCYFQGVKYESIDVKKAITMECTSEDMSRDMSKMTYTDITPHKEAVTEDKDKDKDLSMTSSTSLSTCTAAASEQVQYVMWIQGGGGGGSGVMAHSYPMLHM